MTLEENQKAVSDAAMDRYVQSLEKDAKDSVVHHTSFKQTVQGGFDEEKNEKQRRRTAATYNQSQVLDQIESNKARRAEVRRDHIHAASSHSFPLFTETFIDEEAYDKIRQKQKEHWREELDQQMVTNSMLRNIEERKGRELARRKQVENVVSMTKERELESRRLVHQGQDLVCSWDRDLRLKTLKKAMDSGRDVTREVMQISPGSRGGTGARRSP